ncbi:arylsulfatase, partial [bacterium]|nr:arylsulfatase [bacterium]
MAGLSSIDNSCSAQDAKTSNNKRKPNIIFIMADDLGYGDLGCYGQKLIQTPNIDKLAAEGLRFTQAYAGAPVCTPSRCTLMTGLHNGHSAARDNVPHYHTYLEEEDVTIAEVLKQAGYKCGGVGKWSLGDAGTVGRATNQGFDMWFGYLNQDHAHYYYTEYLDDNEGRLELTGNTQSHAHYSHDLLTERALNFIQQNKDEPFFLYAAYTLPHFASEEEDPDGLSVPTTEPYANRAWDDRSKKYAAMVHRLDRDVGRIVAKIRQLGLSENTLIIFTSDNGGHFKTLDQFHSNGALSGAKRDLNEGGIRVPFIAHWPGVVPAGKTSDEIIAFWDMLPTFAELASAKAPSGIDGVSIADVLKGGKLKTPHEYLYWDYGHCRERYDQAIRMGKWKGIRLGKNGQILLYDLENDIGEKNDVAAKHPDTVRKINFAINQAYIPNSKYEIGQLYKG